LTRARQLLFVSAAVSADSADKGWYGLLRTAWDKTGDTQAGRAFVHVTGTAPEVACAAMPEIPATIPTDPALARPIKTTSALVRIAPSRTSSSGAAGGAAAAVDPWAAQDPDGRRRGIGIHLLLEWLSTPPARTPAQLLAGLAREMQRDADDPELTEWLQEAQGVMRTPELVPLFEPANYEKVYVEAPLSYFKDDVLVDGVVDRVLVTADQVHIIDYKTHGIDATQAIATAHGYREQLRLYAEGARRLWPDRKLRASILFTHCRTLVDLPDG
jgi:ATP-dependent helicase/nuclease subunit A